MCVCVGEGVLISWESGGSAVVILAVHECIRYALMVLVVLPTFDNTSSLGYPLHRVVYHTSVSTLVTREAELKHYHFI